ncbi:hypothetical protein [Algiphilus sp.]|uniref:hypothetical protein n=1 Tax=Algiphilus sp. TaxID=1872431 RepID=UPI0025BBE089|nr:hypothetical protein [Algiphilus sp.]MCK5769489.1 hypothetical protein [Algiphilus sp.]
MSEASPGYSVPATSTRGQPPNRQAVLVRHLRDACDETGLDEATFALGLARRYLREVPEDLRTVDVPDLDDDTVRPQDYLRARGRWYKRVARWADGATMPADMEEHWVAELPAPYGERCARDLVRRYGFMGVLAPEADASTAEDLASVGRVGSDHGRVLQEVSRMLDDGKFGPEDAAIAPNAIAALHDLAADAIGLAARIRDRVGDHPNTVKLRQA